jgi:uncharacterized protein
LTELYTASAKDTRIVALSRLATVVVAIVALFLSVSALVVTSLIVRHVAQRQLPIGWFSALETLVLAPVLVLTLILAIRRSGSHVLPYLRLDIPRWRHVGLAVIALILLIAFDDGLALVLGRRIVDPGQLQMVRLATADGSLIWLLIGTVIAGPIHEELLFRGFLFRGFVRTQRDAIPSIVLISLVWTLMHFSIEWYSICVVFLTGLLFGLVRWQTDSTTLAIVLHVLSNLEASIELEVMLG